MSLALAALLATASPPCKDLGPWSCRTSDTQCINSLLHCAAFRTACNQRWGEALPVLPPALSHAASGYIYEWCPVTCGRCGGESGGAGKPDPYPDATATATATADTVTQAPANVCVSWRQTGGCSPTGKREPQQDRACGDMVPSDSSGYCECDGGIRAGETGCRFCPKRGKESIFLAISLAIVLAMCFWPRESRAVSRPSHSPGVSHISLTQCVPTFHPPMSLPPSHFDRRFFLVFRHAPFTCRDKCVEQWRLLREQREKKRAESAEAGEDFSADENLLKLHKRGKGFYVMGNTELALR